MTVAIVLAGCGVFDGSEINEVVLTLLALQRCGLNYQALAPKRPFTVVNHVTGEDEDNTRCLLQESARLMRGEILDIDKAQAEDYQALIVPGGFGVAKHLCNYLEQGAEMNVHADFMDFARHFISTRKPVGLMCIAPVLAPKLYEQCQVTIGHDPKVGADLQAMGAQAIDCGADDIVIDEENRLVSTPAFMLAEQALQASVGINKLVDKLATWLVP